MAKKPRKRRKGRKRGPRYVAHINRQINKALRRDSLTRGRHNEKYALGLVLEMYRKGLLPDTEDTPYLTDPKSTLDRKGFDLVIPTDKGKVGIQIKSSQAYMERFLARGKSLGLKPIPCVVVNESRDDEEVTRRLYECIWQAYKSLS